MRTTLSRSLPFLCLLVSLLLLVGCSQKSIVGKWRPVGEDSKQFMEFFADGKMTEGPNARGALMEYSLDGDRLTIGPKDTDPAKARQKGRPVVSFPDADHMDWTLEGKYGGVGNAFKQTIRFERVKEGLTIPAK